MANEILVLRTPPGYTPLGNQIRIGTYRVLFLYRVLPAIRDHDGRKIAPTPLSLLVQAIGQAEIDAHLTPTETGSFDSGDGAWELIVDSRLIIRDPGPPVTRRLETISELIDRLKNEYVVRKARALADWAAEYEHTGRRLDAPS